MPIPFEFIVAKHPVSSQSGGAGRRQWQQEVRQRAAARWGAEPPYAGEVMVTIIYFNGKRIDVDNIPKVIVDALKGLVYPDDAAVTDVICRLRHLGADLVVHNPTPVLLNALSSYASFVYVRVDDSPGQEVVL